MTDAERSERYLSNHAPEDWNQADARSLTAEFAAVRREAVEMEREAFSEAMRVEIERWHTYQPSAHRDAFNVRAEILGLVAKVEMKQRGTP